MYERRISKASKFHYFQLKKMKASGCNYAEVDWWWSREFERSYRFM